MRVEEIEEFCGGKNEEYEYHCEVARRLETVVGSSLSLAEAVALVIPLTVNTYRCSGGFVINRHDLLHTLGDKEALSIATSLTADPVYSYEEAWDVYDDLRRRA